MPKSLVKDEATSTETYAKFVAEPFEAGYVPLPELLVRSTSLRRCRVSLRMSPISF